MKPWRKFRPPTGPISPAQNAPAAGIGPSSSLTTPASWSGTPKRWRPRPLQVNTERGPGVDPAEELTEVLVGRRGVAHVELHGLADGHLVADRERARLLVGAQDVAHQEVPARELGLVLVDDEAHVQTVAEEIALVVGGRGGELLQARDRRLSGELLHEVPLRRA